MDLTSLKVIKSLLKKHRAFPSKRFGQNFLIGKSVLQKIVEAANLQPKDIILEIGPGIGTLTQEIAKRVHPVKSAGGGVSKKQFNRVKKVIAIEKDPKMVEILKETTKNLKNVKIIQADILKIQNSKFKIQNSYKVVANLPYYITSPVIRKFLESSNPPKEMILMVQKEVAQRICSKPPDMNLLAISVQFYAQPEIISFVSKKSFWPQPKVDSAIIKVVPFQNSTNYTMVENVLFRKLFFKIVGAGFSQPRKQLVNNLSRLNFSSKNLSGQAKRLALSQPNGLKLDKERVKSWLLKNGIQPSQRAETLGLENWISLSKSFNFLQ